LCKVEEMPVATSATASVGNSSSLQMMHQSKSGSALTSAGVKSIPPAGKKKCPPPPTISSLLDHFAFDNALALKLGVGDGGHFFFPAGGILFTPAEVSALPLLD
jgi:hypothetical protein